MKNCWSIMSTYLLVIGSIGDNLYSFIAGLIFLLMVFVVEAMEEKEQG